MSLRNVGRGLLAAVCLLALNGPALADLGGNVQIRYLVNDIDKISRDQPVGDDAVNKQKVDASGYFTHPDHPGFYGGFYVARELNYKQVLESVGPNEFRNNVIDSSNTVQEIYLGKTYFGDFGELGAELMLGQESQREGLKYRPKLHGRYEFANGISLNGYGTVLIQTYNGPSQSVAADREVFETEIQPGIGYKIDDHMGLWANVRVRDRTQQRALYGDLKEKERFVELGVWKNFGELYTSLRVRSGTFEMWDTLSSQDSTRNSTIRRDKINRLVGSIIEVPTSSDKAWDYEQFTAVLAKLKAVPGVKWPLDLKLNYGGEWLTYGYYPFIKSAGGDIIDSKTWRAKGTINSAATVGAIKNIKSWIDKGYVVPATAGDNRFFGDKTAALSWVGNWMWRAHSQALGDNLVLIPAPRFGSRPYAPNGGWGWAVPSTAQRTEDISKFLNFVLSKEQVAAWSNITGYIPARSDAADLTKLYSKDGKARLLAIQAQEIAVVRPIHPAYPVISSSFGKAISSVFEGADAQKAMDKAASTIDEDIEDNDGYPPFKGK